MHEILSIVGKYHIVHRYKKYVLVFANKKSGSYTEVLKHHFEYSGSSFYMLKHIISKGIINLLRLLYRFISRNVASEKAVRIYFRNAAKIGTQRYKRKQNKKARHTSSFQM